LVEIRGLTKRFGRTLAVDDLSFRAEPGKITGFLGPNGAGKTTTLRAVLGLIDPDAGSATVLGRRYRDLERPARQVGAVLEASSFHPGRRGRNHLRVLAAAAEIPFTRVDEVLALVELNGAAGKRVRAYSLGMRQRLALAAALLGDPEVLVLDEPANGLFVVQSSTADVVARAAASVRVRSPQAEQLREVLAEAGIEAKLSDGNTLAVTRASTEHMGELLAARGIVLHELAAERGTLEEAFLELTAESEGS
jgi:ABC-2 type transport system ATP-binding protein